MAGGEEQAADFFRGRGQESSSKPKPFDCLPELPGASYLQLFLFGLPNEMCASNSWILSASLYQGVGEDGEVRRCENEKHILCKACCNLTEDGEVGNQRHHQHSHHEHQQAMREVLFA